MKKISDKILDLLQRHHADGCSRTQIRDAFGRHRVREIRDALNELLKRGAVHVERMPTNGRPQNRFFMSAFCATHAITQDPSQEEGKEEVKFCVEQARLRAVCEVVNAADALINIGEIYAAKVILSAIRSIYIDSLRDEVSREPGGVAYKKRT